MHACCAPCTAGVYEQIKDNFEVTLFWYNPNIFPKAEHDRRLRELLDFCDNEGIKIIVGEYDWSEEHAYWLDLVKDLENEPERGKRCEICYRMRLEATASIAAQANDHHPGEFDYFTAELSISPHKNAEMINEAGLKIGENLATSHPIESGDPLQFYAADFKKNDGYKKGCEISKEHNLYRQGYCGCEFSIRK